MAYRPPVASQLFSPQSFMTLLTDQDDLISGRSLRYSVQLNHHLVHAHTAYNRDALTANQGQVTRSAPETICVAHWQCADAFNPPGRIDMTVAYAAPGR